MTGVQTCALPICTHEAEDATIHGGVEHANTASANHQGFTGRSFVDYLHPSGDYVEWTVASCAGGPATASFRYALGGGNRPLQVLVNDEEVEASLSFPATGNWRTWSEASVAVNLSPGINRVKLVATGRSGANMDSLTLHPPTLGSNPRADTKCPHNNGDRLFREPSGGSSSITRAECFSQCQTTEGCNHYSWGQHGGANVCMGCSSLDHAQHHNGFTAYDM